MDHPHERVATGAGATTPDGDVAADAGRAEELTDPLLSELLCLAASLPREALVSCRDLLGVLSSCTHEELAEVRQMLTAVRQLPGTPPGAKAVLRGGADLIRALDRALAERAPVNAAEPRTQTAARA